MTASTKPTHTTSSPFLEARSLSKRYEGVLALDGVDLAVERGTVHALVGENGAGKSTLGKVFGGAVRADAGGVWLDGVETSFKSPRDALNGGIALVHQEIALVPSLSVLDNVFLGVEKTVGGLVRMGSHRERFQEVIEVAGFDLDPDAPASSLRVADQQKVEMLRVLVRDAKVMVLDEPTAALTQDESALLLDLVRLLRRRGTTVIYVSHDLDEVLSVADAVTVLKDGRIVSTTQARDEDVSSLVNKMLGRKLESMFPPKAGPPEGAAVVLKASGMCRAGVLHDVSLEVRAGEIVGIAGLMGSGRTELARVLFGADQPDAGAIELNGVATRFRSPREAVRSGVALLPESRKEQGLIMNASIRGNLTLASLSDVTRHGWIRRGAEQAAASRVAEAVDVRMRGLDQSVSLLSGGNQQKVALGKWLLCNPSILIADEPTRGVDVGARSTIYELLRGLAAQGLGVLLISSELEEVMGMAHRILVMHRGRIRAELSGDASEDTILHAAFGGQNIFEEAV